MLDYLSEIENGDVSAPKFVDVHVLERERLAREGQVKTGTRTAQCRGESALDS
jgi:hypothetical protein